MEKITERKCETTSRQNFFPPDAVSQKEGWYTTRMRTKPSSVHQGKVEFFLSSNTCTLTGFSFLVQNPLKPFLLHRHSSLWFNSFQSFSMRSVRIYASPSLPLLCLQPSDLSYDTPAASQNSIVSLALRSAKAIDVADSKNWSGKKRRSKMFIYLRSLTKSHQLTGDERLTSPELQISLRTGKSEARRRFYSTVYSTVCLLLQEICSFFLDEAEGWKKEKKVQSTLRCLSSYSLSTYQNIDVISCDYITG